MFRKGATLKREAFWLSALPGFPDTGRIPKIVHQTFETRDLPPLLQRNVDALKAANPDWEHLFYDAPRRERFIGEVYGERLLRVYRRISPDYGAARADLFRYLAIYAAGGVYLDIKSYFDRPIGDAVAEDDAYIISHWDNGPGGPYPGFGLHPELVDLPRGEFQQWHVIAAPGHPFLRRVIARVLANIERYRPWRDGVGKIGVLRATGPIPYTRAIAPVLDRHPHRVISSPAEIGLNFSIGGGYDHGAVFTKHYSRLTTPVAAVPFWAKPPSLAYGYLKRRFRPVAS